MGKKRLDSHARLVEGTVYCWRLKIRTLSFGMRLSVVVVTNQTVTKLGCFKSIFGVAWFIHEQSPGGRNVSSGLMEICWDLVPWEETGVEGNSEFFE